MKLRILPDISAVKEAGIDYYRDNYFWPVSEDDYHNFIEFMFDTYVDLISKLDNDRVYDIALVEYTFIVSQLTGVFHYNYVKSYAKIEGCGIANSVESYPYLHPNWEEIGLYYSKISFPHGVIMRFIRRIIKNIFFNRHLSIFKVISKLILKSNTLGIGSYDAIKKSYIEKEKIFCDHRDWIDFISLDKQSHKSNELCNELIDEVITPFLNTLEKNGDLFTKNLDFLKILDSWRRRISDAAVIYTNLVYSNDIKFERFLVTEAVKPYSKLISVALQRKGVDVYCFDHGNDSSVTHYKIGNQNERAHCKKNVVPTIGVKSQYENIYSDGILEERTKTQYISIGTSKYIDLLERNSKEESSLNLKKIMVIGTPPNVNRYFYEKGWFFYFKVDLELRIINILRSCGYYIIYKAHPDRLKEAKGLFENHVDKYITDPYEQVWQLADSFVFTDTASSTFGYALTTNRHIVLLDNIENIHSKKTWELLKKRVNVIPTYIDNKMHIVFNKYDFCKSFKETHLFYDNTFVETIFGKV
jgi:hypothetical protein